MNCRCLLPAAALLVANLSSAAQPWTHLDFADEPEDFRFAVIPDRGGGDYRGAFTNALRCADLMHPAFVMSVGDLINGFGGTDARQSRQQDELTNMTSRVRAPFFYTIGNHDINISRPGATNDYAMTRAVWRRYFGPREYYSFTYKRCLFLVLNSMEQWRDIGKRPKSGMSDGQYAWVRRTLAEHADARWTFIFHHHPTEWTTAAWQALEKDALGDRKYTVFAGDWHSYFHVRRHGRDHYVLSVAGGVSNMGYHHKTDRAKLAGQEYGEMDHIAWVTMTKDGPEVVNLKLDGILPGDYLNRATSLDDTCLTVLDVPPDPKALERVRELRARRDRGKQPRE